MTIEQLIEEKNGEVKILDLIKYPELHDLEVKPVEKVTDEDSVFADYNDKTTVYYWTDRIYQLAIKISYNRPEVEQIYRELMEVNFEEA